MCYIIPISRVQCWFNPAPLSKHRGPYWRVPDCQRLLTVDQRAKYVFQWIITHLKPAQCELARHLTPDSKSFPAPTSSFCCFATAKPHAGRTSATAASREAHSRDWDGGQDGRWASSFTSYMRVQSSDSLWECWVDSRRKAQLRRLRFPLRMSSRFCAQLWHRESWRGYTRTQTSPWTWHTYRHASMRMLMHTCVCTFTKPVTVMKDYFILNASFILYWLLLASVWTVAVFCPYCHML